MTRQSRMLLIVGAVGLGSVVVLMMMAQRYNSVLEERAERAKIRSATGSAATEAQSLVDAFIAVRRELKQALDSSRLPADPGEVVLAPLRQARDRGLRTAELEHGAYLRIRTMYRNWKGREPKLTPSFDRAFETRRKTLEALDLGALEALDL